MLHVRCEFRSQNMPIHRRLKGQTILSHPSVLVVDDYGEELENGNYVID